jgi:hypothetical protein
MSNRINVGRQYTLVVEQPFDYTDLLTAALSGGKVKFKPKLPANAIPLRGQVVVLAAFNGTTPTLDVAGETSGATYATAADLATVGTVALTVVPSVLGSGDLIAMTPDAGVQTATQGKGILIMEYLISGRGQEAQP